MNMVDALNSVIIMQVFYLIWKVSKLNNIISDLKKRCPLFQPDDDDEEEEE
jgi:hypothetical protein